MSLDSAHAEVWGSFYCSVTHRWGYACCLLCERDCDCGRVNPALEGPSADADDVGGREVVATSEVTHHAQPESVGERPVKKQKTGVESSENLAGAPPTGSAAARLAAVKAEVDRIMSTPKTKPFSVLGLSLGPDAYSVRSAFRRIALLIHPDKNPGLEDACKQALVRVTEAREAIDAGAGNMSVDGANFQNFNEASTNESEHRSRDAKKKPPVPRADVGPAKEHDSRDAFLSADEFVSSYLQYLLDDWQRYVVLALPSGAAAQAQSRGAAVRAAAAARAGGQDSVVQSEAALKQVTGSVKSLRKLLKKGMLGDEVLDKIDKMCCEIMAKEYQAANQVYMQIAIGNKAWIMEVPSMVESGMAGLSGKERGGCFKQARMAAKLNSGASNNVMDDGEMRQHIVSLKRLLTVAQVIHPNVDISKNTC